METAVSSATIGTAYLRGEPVRGIDRAYAISQLAGAIMAEVADWTEAQILVECRRLNRLRGQPPLADGEVRNGVRRTIASLRRQTWREIELRSSLNYSHPTRHTFPHTVESERQVLLIGQTIDEMREEGYSDAVIPRECQVLNARHFAPPLDPAPLRGFIDYVLVTFDPDAPWSLIDHGTMIAELSTLLGRQADLVSRRGIERSENWIRRRAILESAHVIYTK